MPFGWVGCDASDLLAIERYMDRKSPMPFGWVGCDALKGSATIDAWKTSPMPFGWVGCDAMNIIATATTVQEVSNAFRLGWL